MTSDRKGKIANGPRQWTGWTLTILGFLPCAPGLAAPPQTPLTAPLYSFDLASPAVAQEFVKADDVLALNQPFPVTAISGAALGLGAVGDELDALSSGHPLFPSEARFTLLFSVSRESVGTAPPDPALVALGVPYNVFDQGARGQAAGDEFISSHVYTSSGPQPGTTPNNNTLDRNNYDEGGTDFAGRPETSAQSVTVGQPQDNVDALADVTALVEPYFSAGAFSPSLTTLSDPLPPSGAHIFRRNALEIMLYASFDELGLEEEDDIDALIVFDIDGDTGFDDADWVLFSLTPDSPSLDKIAGASVNGAAADVFIVIPETLPAVFASAASLGLGADSDDIDALEFVLCTDSIACAAAYGIRLVQGDFDDDGDVDGADLNSFDECFGGDGQSYAPGCEPGDFDDDADIDCQDWSGFSTAWTEENPPPTIAQCQGDIPAVSDWGLIVLTITLLAMGSVIILQRDTRPHRAA